MPFQKLLKDKERVFFNTRSFVYHNFMQINPND